MNVKLAAQVLSSSVADSIDFLRKAKDPRFSNSEGTIKFIREVDRLFDLLNSRNPHEEGYKKPLKLENKTEWFAAIDSSINYLHNLKDEYGCPLISQRRNTFVKGLITAAKSIKELPICIRRHRSSKDFNKSECERHTCKQNSTGTVFSKHIPVNARS